jgi:agmatinase
MVLMKMLHQMPPYNLFGIFDQDYKSAKVAVLPVPYDSTTTYKSGARDGPHAIIEASRSIEFFSEELEKDVTKIGIFTMEELEPNYNSPKETVDRIEKEVGILLEDGKLPVLLGGEHSIAMGSISATSKKYGKDNFSVIHFDAHSDSRDEYMGSRYCHACVMARARESCSSCISIGVRSTDEEGFRKYAGDTIYRKDMHGKSPKDIAADIIKRTRRKVYITIDLDVIDPALIPSTGTPEPDGLNFYEITQILKELLSRKELVGLDFNEFSPIAGLYAPNYLVAKLIYLSLGYNFCITKKK